MGGSPNDLSSVVADSLERIAGIDFFATAHTDVRDEDVARLAESIGVTRIGWTTGLDRLSTPTVYCVRPAALHPCAIYSSGKAFDPHRALLSGMFECYERWAAEQPAFCVEATADDLVDHPGGRDLAVFEPAGDESDVPLKWALGKRLGSAQFAAVPACYVEFPPRAPAAQDVTTTGLAAHAGFAEACSNALLECIERHHTAALAPSTMARVAATDFSEQAACLAQIFAREDIELHTFIIDPEARFKTAYCYAYDHWLGVPRSHCSGFGAATGLRAAVEKAMLEVVQSRAAMISGLRDDVAAFSARWRDDHRENSEHRTWLETLRAVERVFDPASGEPEPAETLAGVLAGLAADELTPLIFPLRTAAGFPAVRAFVPELDDCR